MISRQKTKFAIVDIETTGGLFKRDRITEIAVVIHDGTKIVDRYESLVNPERSVPPEITRITGITNEMVQDAPKFYEIAKDIVEITEGAVFVAHNVRFDYSFVKEEFAQLGFTFTRKQLCTVKLSRMVFPGLKSYSLGNLIKHFNLVVKNRHRALDDALATAEIFRQVIASDSSQGELQFLINHGIRETQLPQNIKFEKLHALPEKTGVYYFHDQFGDVIYVGKAINIKTRVFQHFRKTSKKAAALYHRVHDISFEITGSELIALLLEVREIKAKHPDINKAMKRMHFQYFLTTAVDPEGYIRYEILKNNEKNRKDKIILREYSKLKYARYHLEKLIQEDGLCANRTYFSQFSQTLCSCAGLCRDESIEEYNIKAREIEFTLSKIFSNSFFILDEGRESGEIALVYIEDGKYYGFGYQNEDQSEMTSEDLLAAVRKEPFYPIMNKLIWNQMKIKDYKILQPNIS